MAGLNSFGIPVPPGWAGARQIPQNRILPPQPEQGPSLDDCLCALKQMLEGALTTGDLAPHIHQPFDAVTKNLRQRSIIAVPAAADATAWAAALALLAAEDIYASGLAFLTPTQTTAPFAPQIALSYTCPQGFVAVFKSWGITVENADPDAVAVTATIDGENNGSTPPDPYLSGAAENDQQKTMLVIPENKSVKVLVQNLDTASPLLVTVGMFGWQLPVKKYEQSLKSMLKRPGFGSACGPNGNAGRCP